MAWDVGDKTMKLEYDVIEDDYDDTTQIRTMTEQARIPACGWLVRTTLYTPHNMSVDVAYVPARETEKTLFEPLG